MSDLARLVETLFALRGYTAEPSAGAVLRFKKHGDHIAVKIRDTKDPVPAYAAREVAETLPALGHAVLVCVGDLGHEARVILETAAIDVWTREKLIHEVGKTYLEAAEHGTLPRAFAPPLLEPPNEPEPSAAPPPTPSPVATPAPAPSAPSSPVATPTVASLWARAASPAPAAASEAPPVATIPRLFPARASAPPAQPLTPSTVSLVAPSALEPSPSGPTERVLASKLTRDEVVKLATGRLLRVDNATLELVPIHAFRYRCSLETPGAPPVAKQGLLGVDAVTGAAREMVEPLFGPAEGGSKLQPLLGDLDAGALAKKKIVELHTQKVRAQNALSRNTLIVEDKWVRPNPQTMVLDHQGVWWMPLWRLEGQNGSLRLNGTTGAVEEEKLKRAFADSAEFI